MASAQTIAAPVGRSSAPTQALFLLRGAGAKDGKRREGDADEC